jgi:hypothetical protein
MQTDDEFGDVYLPDADKVAASAITWRNLSMVRVEGIAVSLPPPSSTSLTSHSEVRSLVI